MKLLLCIALLSIAVYAKKNTQKSSNSLNLASARNYFDGTIKAAQGFMKSETIQHIRNDVGKELSFCKKKISSSSNMNELVNNVMFVTNRHKWKLVAGALITTTLFGTHATT